MNESIERLHQALDDALAASRSAKAAQDETAAVDESQQTDALPDNVTSPDESDEEDTDDLVEAVVAVATPIEIGSQVIAGSAVAQLASGPVFKVADLSSFKADADNFFEFAYRPTLQAMVDAVIEAEAPIRDDVLAQRVARAHGWLRTGARIRERIRPHLRDLDRVEETSGTFLWKSGTVRPRIPFRIAATPNDRRSLSEIPIAELVDFILSNATALDESDPALTLARLMQIERLAGVSRRRLDEAIAQSRSPVA